MTAGVLHQALVASFSSLVRTLTGSFTASAVDAANQTSYTFNTQSIGAADASRIVVVAVSSSDSTDGATSVTIGGNAATFVVEALTTGGFGCSIWYLAVPTGTTANIVVNFGDQQSRCGIGVYRIVSNDGNVPTLLDSDALYNLSTSVTGTVATETGGFVIAAGFSSAAGSNVWTGLTEDYENDAGEPCDMGSASGAPATDASYDVTFANSSAANCNIAIASFS